MNKKIKKLGIGIAILIYIYSSIWTILVNDTYGKYEAGFENHISFTSKDGYNYGVNRPIFPRFEGSVYISQDFADEDKTIDMLIFPEVLGGDEIFITIYIVGLYGNKDERNDITFEVNKQMQLLDTANPEVNKIYKENYDMVEHIFELARNRWDFMYMNDK